MLRIITIFVFVISISIAAHAQDTKPEKKPAAAKPAKKSKASKQIDAHLQSFVKKLDDGVNAVLSGKSVEEAFNKEATLKPMPKMNEADVREDADAKNVNTASLAAVRVVLYFVRGKDVAYRAKGFLYQNKKGIKLFMWRLYDYTTSKERRTISEKLLPENGPKILDPLAKAFNLMCEAVSDDKMTFESSPFVKKFDYFEGELQNCDAAPRESRSKYFTIQQCRAVSEQIIDLAKARSFDRVIVDIDGAGWICRDKAGKFVGTLVVDTQVKTDSTSLELAIRRIIPAEKPENKDTDD